MIHLLFGFDRSKENNGLGKGSRFVMDWLPDRSGKRLTNHRNGHPSQLGHLTFRPVDISSPFVILLIGFHGF